MTDDPISALRNIAHKAYTSRNFSQALSLYSQLIAEGDEPTFMDFFFRGRCHYQLKRYRGELEDLSEVLRLIPPPASLSSSPISPPHSEGESLVPYLYLKCLSNKAWCFFHLKEYPLAVCEAEKALELAIRKVPMLNLLSATYSRMGVYDVALKYGTQAIEANPDRFYGRHYRGTTYYLMREFDLALVDLSQAIAINDNLLVAYNYRGYVYAAKGNFEEAIADFSKCLGDNHQSPENLSSRRLCRCFCYCHLDDLGAASVDLEKSYDLRPDFPLLTDSRLRVDTLLTGLSRFLPFLKESSATRELRSLLGVLLKEEQFDSLQQFVTCQISKRDSVPLRLFSSLIVMGEG